MPVKFWQTLTRFWVFLSYLITAVSMNDLYIIFCEYCNNSKLWMNTQKIILLPFTCRSFLHWLLKRSSTLKMAARPIREVQGLNIVYKHINSDKNENGGLEPVKYFAVENAEDLANAESNHPWILKEVSNTMYIYYAVWLRVSKVVADHDDLLTQSRYI